MNYFLAPRSGEKSYKNYESTIINGVPLSRIKDYLTPEGVEKLSSEDVIYAWGNREGTRSQWEKMEYGDTVIFYAHRKLVMAAEVYYKQHHDKLAEAMWPLDENGKPWSYTFFLRNIRYISIPMQAFNLIAGYKPNFIVQGFSPISENYLKTIEAKYGSVENLLDQFSNNQSEEIPLSNEPLYVNVDAEIEPELVTDAVMTPRVINTNTPRKKNKPYKIDYTERSRKNAITGSKGEELVVKEEMKRLIKLGKPELSEKVKRVSSEDDSLGYDVLSYEPNGQERHIEVKTSESKNNSVRFFMSQNEYKAAHDLDNYHIYYVEWVNDKTPRITVFNDGVDNGDFLVRPDSYVIEATRS